MGVVFVLLVLIVLITLILIFGGREQRLENKRIEQERRNAQKEAKKAIKQERKNIKKIKNNYADLFKEEKNEEEEKKQEENGIQKETILDNEIESYDMQPIKDEKNMELTMDSGGYINNDDSYQEAEQEEKDNIINIEEKKEENIASEGKDKEDLTKEYSEEDLGIKFLFDIEDEKKSVEDELEKYIKEAQEKDIGYLNGDEPETNKIEEDIKEEEKKTTTKKTSEKTEKKSNEKKIPKKEEK